MTSTPTAREHPVIRAVAVAGAVLAEAADLPMWSATTEELARLAADLVRLSSAVAAVEAGVLAEASAREFGLDQGATSTAAWLARTTRLTPRKAHRRVRVAADLAKRRGTATALADGTVNTEQAGVVLDAVAAVADLPDDLAADRGLDRDALAAAAEERLLAEAAHHDARALRVLGRRILDVVAPEVVEDHERRLLEAEERRARECTRLTLTDDGHGRVHGRFTLPSMQGSMLRTALLALAAPKHQAVQRSLASDGADGANRVGPGPVPGRPPPQRLGAAFAELIERYPVDRLPSAGGAAATVVVTIGLDQLRSGLGAGVLDDGGRISASQARRLACEAGLVPMVLDGSGAPLDVGRRRRLHTLPQRLALGVRDGGCTAEGCDWPPGLCHAHHDDPWSHGGGTSVDNGRLLCPRHHAFAHDPRYRSSSAGTGKIRFTRRT